MNHVEETPLETNTSIKSTESHERSWEEIEKTCTACCKSKKLSEYSTHKLGKFGRRPRCRECCKREMRHYRNRSGIKDREKTYKKEYRSKNHEHIIEVSRAYHARPESKERQRQYAQANKERIRKNQRVRKNFRKKNDVLFRVKENLRNRIRLAILYKRVKKTRKTADLIGCPWAYLLKHLGVKTIEDLKDMHVDHICPLSEAQTVDELYKLCHWSNLQLLSSKDNMLKNDTLTKEGEKIRMLLIGR
jgi:hypothetical protein